jgi:hypothetical protein
MGRLLLAAAQGANRSRAANICQFRAASGDRLVGAARPLPVLRRRSVR